MKNRRSRRDSRPLDKPTPSLCEARAQQQRATHDASQQSSEQNQINGVRREQQQEQTSGGARAKEPMEISSTVLARCSRWLRKEDRPIPWASRRLCACERCGWRRSRRFFACGASRTPRPAHMLRLGRLIATVDAPMKSTKRPSIEGA